MMRQWPGGCKRLGGESERKSPLNFWRALMVPRTLTLGRPGLWYLGVVMFIVEWLIVRQASPPST